MCAWPTSSSKRRRSAYLHVWWHQRKHGQVTYQEAACDRPLRQVTVPNQNCCPKRCCRQLPRQPKITKQFQSAQSNAASISSSRPRKIPSFLAMPVKDVPTKVSCAASSRSYVRQCIPLGLPPGIDSRNCYIPAAGARLSATTASSTMPSSSAMPSTASKRARACAWPSRSLRSSSTVHGAPGCGRGRAGKPRHQVQRAAAHHLEAGDPGAEPESGRKR